jgi:hypothetical protein
MSDEETSERRERTLSVRIEVVVSYTDATDLERAKRNLKELAQAAVERSPWTERVYFAGITTRR